MTLIQRHEQGSLLSVRATPGARKNEIRGQLDGALKVAVTQVAEKGRANVAVRDHLAKTFRLRESQKELVSGHVTAQKKFLIRDLAPEELQSRLAVLLEG